MTAHRVIAHRPTNLTGIYYADLRRIIESAGDRGSQLLSSGFVFGFESGGSMDRTSLDFDAAPRGSRDLAPGPGAP